MFTKLQMPIVLNIIKNNIKISFITYIKIIRVLVNTVYSVNIRDRILYDTQVGTYNNFNSSLL